MGVIDKHMAYFIELRCAWCGKLTRWVSSPDPADLGLKSHGICSDCYGHVTKDRVADGV